MVHIKYQDSSNVIYNIITDPHKDDSCEFAYDLAVCGYNADPEVSKMIIMIK